jgi:hypothetical protein
MEWQEIQTMKRAKTVRGGTDMYCDVKLRDNMNRQ